VNSAHFFWFYVTYRKDLLMALLGCTLVTAAAELTMPWLLRQALDTTLGEISGTSLEASRAEIEEAARASGVEQLVLAQSALYRKLLAEMGHPSLETPKAG